MKSVACVSLCLSLLTMPLAASSQPSSSATRAEVRAELAALARVGYNPGTANDEDYPSNIIAAQARVRDLQARQNPDPGGYGSQTGGSSETGK